ncbi:MAG: uracil-DNA glycosylase [Rhodobacteraceae bacterium]|nr:MAG: uracil-DNA glycosylase [Paracoccaceae bacterium]
MEGDLRERLLAALAWQVELGADEAIAEAPVDRFAAAVTPAPPAKPTPAAKTAPAPHGAMLARPASGAGDAAQAAREIAAACDTLEALHAALAAFEGCALKTGARRCVFSDGNPAARVMVIGEAPGREEDMAGKPFVGRSGKLLDRMLAAIGLDRTAEDPDHAVYVGNVVPWRPIENRTPSADEIAVLLPFVRRQIALAAPEFVVLAGGTPAKALFGTETGILRLRGEWRRLDDGPLALATLHPAYLLRSPPAKRHAWRDLLALRAALDGEAPALD